jgi:hypothetical protein
MANQAAKNIIIKGLKDMAGVPVKAEFISMSAGLVETDDTYPKARKIIRELIDDGYCIGSSNEGYYLMQSGKEVQVYLNSLLQRQIAISNRIAAVYYSGKKEGLL